MPGKTLRVAVRSSTEVYSFSRLGAEPERISSWRARRVRMRASPRSPGHGHRHRGGRLRNTRRRPSNHTPTRACRQSRHRWHRDPKLLSQHNQADCEHAEPCPPSDRRSAPGPTGKHCTLQFHHPRPQRGTRDLDVCCRKPTSATMPRGFWMRNSSKRTTGLERKVASVPSWSAPK